jgi:hypothetical protein
VASLFAFAVRSGSYTLKRPIWRGAVALTIKRVAAVTGGAERGTAVTVLPAVVLLPETPEPQAEHAYDTRS